MNVVSAQALQAIDGGQLTVPGDSWLLKADFTPQGPDLLLTGADGAQVVIRDFFNLDTPPDLVTDSGAMIPADLAVKLAGATAPGQFALLENGPFAELAQAAQSIGQVEATDGLVEAIRLDGTKVSLSKGDDIFQGDTLITAKGAAIGITFVDDTTFSLGEEGRMVIDEMVYDAETQEGQFSANLVQGVFSFVSGQIAKTGPDAMTVTTPVATIGIRGTWVAGRAAQEGTENTISLLPETNAQGVQFVGELLVTNQGGTVTLSSIGATVQMTSAFQPPPPPVVFSQQQIQQNFGSTLTTLSTTAAAKAQADAAENTKAAETAQAEAAQAGAEAEAAAAEAEAAQAAAEAAAAEAEASGDPEAIAAAEAAAAEAEAKAAEAEAKVAEAEAKTAEAEAKTTEAQVAQADAEHAAREMQAQAKAFATLGQLPGDGPSDGDGPTGGDGPIGGGITGGGGNDIISLIEQQQKLYGQEQLQQLDLHDQEQLKKLEQLKEQQLQLEKQLQEIKEANELPPQPDSENTLVTGDDITSVFDDVVTATSGNDNLSDPTSANHELVGGEGNTQFIMTQGSTLGGTDIVKGNGGTDEIAFKGMNDLMGIFQGGTNVMTYSTSTGNNSPVTGSVTLTSVEQLYANDGVETFTDAASAGASTGTNGVRLDIANSPAGYFGYIRAGTDGADTISLAGNASPQTFGSLTYTIDDTTILGSIVFGRGGIDDITGTVESDVIFGGLGDDIIDGGGSDARDNDILIGGAGNDTFNMTTLSLSSTAIVGGTEADTVNYTSYASNLSFLFAGSTNTATHDTTVSDALFGIETLNGVSNGAYTNSFTFSGDSTGTNNIATINGGVLADTFTIATGASVSGALNGGAGDDTYTFASGTSFTGTLDGGTGSDTLNLTDGANTLNIAGFELISGGAENDSLTLSAAQASGSYDLGAGTDSLTLANGGNTLGVSNTETITGGSGTDSISLSSATAQTVSVSAVETITGGSNIDTITVTDSTATTIYGNGGADIITGGGGNDIITGGAGNDTLNSGSGTDVFVYTATALNSGDMLSTAFDTTDAAIGDIIDFSALMEGLLTTGAGATQLSALIANTNLASALDANNNIALVNAGGGDMQLQFDTLGNGSVDFYIDVDDTVALATYNFATDYINLAPAGLG